MIHIKWLKPPYYCVSAFIVQADRKAYHRDPEWRVSGGANSLDIFPVVWPCVIAGQYMWILRVQLEVATSPGCVWLDVCLKYSLAERPKIQGSRFQPLLCHLLPSSWCDLGFASHVSNFLTPSLTTEKQRRLGSLSKHARVQRNFYYRQDMIFNSKPSFVPALPTHQDLCIRARCVTLFRNSFFLFATFLTNDIDTPIWEWWSFYFSLLMPRLLLTVCAQAKQSLPAFHNLMPRTLLPSEQLVFISALLRETCGDWSVSIIDASVQMHLSIHA